jgi:hypothetical protein
VDLYVHSSICLHGVVLKLAKHRDNFTLPLPYSVRFYEKGDRPYRSDIIFYVQRLQHLKDHVVCSYCIFYF